MKHAQAHSIVLDIEVKSDALKFRYEDDGVGFDKELASKGNTSGLKNMNDRVRLLSGSIQLDSNEGQGTKILIQIPLNQSVHE
jgi:signal transduction histidine kinase